MDEISAGQRALWTTLITSLAAPFFGALTVFAISVVAGLLGKGPDSLKALDGAGQLAWAADKAVATFAWGAVPAVAGGLAMGALILLRGRVRWLEAALIGAIAATIAAFLTGGIVWQHAPPVAVIGSLVALAMWGVLSRAGILPR
ncbi:MAG: hypothetical protein ACT4N2_09550 [Hyphomicrobium sp.]